MAANPRYANGHRRRQLRQRLLATAGRTTCTWGQDEADSGACPWPDEPFDPSIHYLDDRAPEVDEIIPVSLGGDPLSRANARLLHRWCNQQRGNGTRTPTQATSKALGTPTTSRTW
jgi:hypothetical protein